MCWFTRLNCLLALACLSACSTDQADERHIQWAIVDYAPSTAGAVVWKLDSEPLFTIGAANGNPGEISAQNIGGAVIDDDALTLTDRARGQVHYLSPDARVYRTVGGHGTEPGRFARFTDMGIFVHRRSRSLVVADDGNNRVQRFRGSGEQVEVVPLPEGARLSGVFADGTWLVQFAGAISTRRQGPVDSHDHHWRYSDTGQRMNKLVTVRSAGRLINAAGRISDYVDPFAVQPSTAAVGDRLWVASGPEPSVDSYDLQGQPQKRYRWAVERRSSESARARFYKGLTRLPKADSDVLSALVIPESLPAYRRMLADHEGRLWFEKFRSGAELSNPSEWDVLDPLKGPVGRVVTPADFDVLHVSRNVVVGLAKAGANRVVRAYRFNRSSDELNIAGKKPQS